MKRLAEYFGVDELDILGMSNPLFVPEDPKVIGKSETDQIIERLLKQLEAQPKTAEARIVSGGMDKLPKDQREKVLKIFCALYPGLVEEENDEA